MAAIVWISPIKMPKTAEILFSAVLSRRAVGNAIGNFAISWPTRLHILSLNHWILNGGRVLKGVSQLSK